MQADYLWVADPKAIHHIFQAAGHLYEKPAFSREFVSTFMDKGVAWAAGESPLVFLVEKSLILNQGTSINDRGGR